MFDLLIPNVGLYPIITSPSQDHALHAIKSPIKLQSSTFLDNDQQRPISVLSFAVDVEDLETNVETSSILRR